MADNKSTFLGPFLLTFFGVTVLGLIVMYFGFYQTRIEAYESYVANYDTKTDKSTALEFTVDDSGVTRGESKSPKKEVEPDKKKSVEKKPDPKKPANKTGDGKKSKVGTSEADDKKSGKTKPINRKTKRPSARRKTRFNQPKPGQKKNSNEEADDDKPVNRGPAFPSSRGNDSDSNTDDQTASGNDVPDINDPEMDDNPLIRALRQASEKQKDNPRPRDNDGPPVNPFEAILSTDR